MSRTFSDEFSAWIDALDDSNELTLDQLILMNEAWEASAEYARTKRIEALTKPHTQGTEND